MTLTIAKEHLQFARSLMHPSPNLVEIFFGSPRPATLMLFREYDLQARYNAALRTKNTDVEPSYFLEKIIEFSGYTLNEIIAAVAQEMDPEMLESIKDKGANLSFNLYTFYVMPMLAANRFVSPYLPASSIDAFFHEKDARNPREKMAYMGSILEFINGCGMNWIEPYKNLSGQLGRDGAATILLMFGLFKEACEGMHASTSPPIKLSPPIEEFLKKLENDSR